MPFLPLIALAIIQGITEFLPVSSSAHLILFPTLTGIKDQGSIIDISVHLGTLIAVISYFRSDAASVFKGFGGVIQGQVRTRDDFLALCLLIATIPAVLFGLFLNTFGFTSMVRENIGLIGITMLGFGLLLWVADRNTISENTIDKWTLKQALILGLWQAIALIPGTSRAGITITGARFMGYKREDAARISMLMSIPVIIAAAVIGMADAIRLNNFLTIRDGAIATFFSAVSAYIALSVMMNWVKRISFTPFVIYRIVLGALLIWWAYA